MSVKPSQFQAATIEWAIQQLTARDRAARRFLVADEVGLGKTTVAREVIAQFIKDKRPALLREKRNLRVVYLTSNMNVARQNSDRLIEDIDHRSSADRVIADIRNALTKKSVAFTPSYPVELFSWTPSTSIMPQNRRSSRSERLLITYLLCRMYRLPYTQGARLFAMVKDEDKFAFDLRSWKREHSRMPRNIYRIIRDAWSAYTFQYDSQTYELSDLAKLQTRNTEPFKALCRTIVADLRLKLISHYLEQNPADLIILDEFQKTPDLIRFCIGSVKTAPPNEVIQRKLVNAFLQRSVPTLLLSATPYTLFSKSTNDSESSEHYESLGNLFKFLSGDVETGNRLLSQVSAYGRSISELTSPDITKLLKPKEQLQKSLMRFMSRIERSMFEGSDSSPDWQLLSENIGRKKLKYSAEHFAEFFRIRDSGSSVAAMMAYWKSGRNPLTYMPQYEAFKDWEKKNRPHSEKLYREARGAHLKLDYLSSETLGPSNNAFQYLWLPPTRPYYAGEGVYSQKALQEFEPRKALVFSHWAMAPKYISSEFAFERDAYFKSELRFHEKIARRKVGGTTTAWCSLFFPSKVLADLISQSDFLQSKSVGELEQLALVRIERVIKALGVSVSRESKTKPWEVLASIEMRLSKNEWESALSTYSARKSSRRTGKTADDNGQALDAKAYLALKGFEPVTHVSPQTLRELARVAVSSPSVCLRRAITTLAPGIEWAATDKRVTQRDRLFDFCIRSLKSFINRRHSLLAMHLASKDSRLKEAHINAERYFRSGNIQAVWDEYLFVLNSHTGKLPALTILNTLAAPFSPMRTGFKLKLRKGARSTDRVLTDFAVAFNGNDAHEGSAEGGAEKATSTDQIRTAFNSPFWPFVLATTSIGQEGLDFHLYCRDIVHWDLPVNPIAFEQREGRINRYNNLSVRQTAANFAGLAAENGSSHLWQNIFERVLAKGKYQDRYNHGMSPHWILSTSDGQQSTRIRRHIMDMPFTRDRDRYEKLMDDVALYRLAMGQPNQTEFLRGLQKRAQITAEQARDLAPNLFPQPTAERLAESFPLTKESVEQLLTDAALHIRRHSDGRLRIELLAQVRFAGLHLSLPGALDSEKAIGIVSELLKLINPHDAVPDRLGDVGMADDLRSLRRLGL